MAAPRKYSDELRERAVRLVFERGRPIAHVARDLAWGSKTRSPVCGAELAAR
jgi:transposase